MSLRRQLLLISLLLLSLPWAGCQFIREMEGALRQGQEQSLQATASAVAATLGEQEQLLYPNPARRSSPADQRTSLYAKPSGEPLILDGYVGGWEDIEGGRFESAPGASPLAVDYRAMTRNGYLYLLLQVQDPDVIYHNPGLSPEPNGDRLILRTWQSGQRQDYVIATAAPGSVRARAASRRLRGANPGHIKGSWQDTVGGYTLELEIPLSYTGGRLGFYLANAGRRSGGTLETLGNISPLETSAPPWLIYSPDTLQQTVLPFSRQGSHIRVIDRENWLVADLAAAAPVRDNTSDTFWLLQVMYRSILSQQPLAPPPPPPGLGKVQGEEIQSALLGSAANHRYRDPNYSTRTTLSAAAPILYGKEVIGAVVVQQSGEEYLSLTDQAFSHLLGYSVLAVGIGAMGLLAYASLLSWRIGRLSHAARNAIRDDGVVLDSFPRSRAGDEIGALSRHYADLLDQLREYNDYLRTLSRKLSHELRTPIAVIQTSLENLEQATDKEVSGSVYLQRAQQGLQRLNRILTAMSEANRLEESIRNNESAALDLVPLLREIFVAYQGIYPDHQLQLDIQPETALTCGVAELLVQALDKLMDNAASFCPAGESIVLELKAAAGGWNISVSNAGPPLPPEMQDHLFEPMVSVRERGSEQVHLGLGLHIVRLISDFHGGQIHADNLPGGAGVRFTLTLPHVNPAE
jgi:two-component system sensor histidine kinase ChvG